MSNYAHVEGTPQYEGPVTITYSGTYRSCCSCKWYKTIAILKTAEIYGTEDDVWEDQKFCTQPGGPRSLEGGYPQVVNETPSWCPASPVNEFPCSI